MKKCPICGHDKCADLVVDLLICNSCSHIFKKELHKQTHSSDALHLYINPIEEIRRFVDNTRITELEFTFPSMMFYTLEIKPSQFYKSEYNHYFNQMSLIILLERCGFKPVSQINRWSSKICETILRVRRE